MSSLAPLLEAFFTERLGRQRQASPNTVRSYRDTFRLLLVFAQHRTGKAPSQLELADLDAGLVSAFLDHLEAKRHNSVRTRNARMAAVRSLFRFASYLEPADAAVIQRVLALPDKRSTRRVVSWLSPAEAGALLAAPDPSTWIGRRDHAVLVTALQTGLRVSELTGLRRRDLVLGTGAHLRCHGKGRKERCTPLTGHTVAVLRTWLAERGGGDDEAVFPSRRGTALSPDSVGDLVDRNVAVARRACAEWATARVTPHTLRHTAAMTLLAAGVDVSGDRPVARPRARPDDADLPPRRPDDEATGARPHQAGDDAGGPLPAPRCPAHLPRWPLIIRDGKRDSQATEGLPSPRPG